MGRNTLFFPYSFQFTCVTFSVNTRIHRLKSFPLLIRSFITSAAVFVDRELCAGPDTVYIGVAPSSLTLDDDVSTHVSRRFNSRGRPAATASNISSFHFQNRVSIKFYHVSHVYTNESRKTKQWISIMTYKSTVLHSCIWIWSKIDRSEFAFFAECMFLDGLYHVRWTLSI